MSKVDIFNIDKKYNIIYADPPWSYRDKGCNGNCESHYTTMKLKNICNLPRIELFARQQVDGWDCWGNEV